MRFTKVAVAAIANASGLAPIGLGLAAPLDGKNGLSVQISVADGLLGNSTNGRVMVLLAPVRSRTVLIKI